MRIKAKEVVELVLSTQQDMEERFVQQIDALAEENTGLKAQNRTLQAALGKEAMDRIAPSVMAERKRCLQIVMLQFGSDCFHTPAKQAGFDKTYQELLDCIMGRINSGDASNG